MAGTSGINELEDFADSMREVSGQGRSDGIQKARRDALRATTDDFIDILTKIIKGRETSKGGTLDSRTSPYDPGTTNESTESTLHISDKKAWDSTIVGNDTAVVFPKPEVNKRAKWLEYGTADHGPRDGENPLHFYLNNVRIVVTEGEDEVKGLEGADATAIAYHRIRSDSYSTQAGEVSGVDRQNFFKDAIKVLRSENIFERNMEKELNKEFAENGIEITGDW